MEKWKDIHGYEGIYAISNEGRVFSYRTNKILKPGIVKRGYLRVTLCTNGKEKYVYIHRLVADAFVKGYEEGKEVNHKDGNVKNNKAENLEWVSRSENIIHSYKHLNRVSPAKNKKIAEKLTEQQVHEIRFTNKPASELAKKFGVTKRTIYSARSGHTYKEFPMQPLQQRRYHFCKDCELYKEHTKGF